MRINHTVGSVNIKFSTDRIDRNMKEAQKALNMQVAADCEPYIPFRQGALRSSQGYPEGIYGGIIEWNVPYAHYLYRGLLRTDEKGRVFVGKDEKKPVLTDSPLTYHHHGTGSMWFEMAKQAHCKDWVDLVKRKVGKG